MLFHDLDTVVILIYCLFFPPAIFSSTCWECFKKFYQCKWYMVIMAVAEEKCFVCEYLKLLRMWIIAGSGMVQKKEVKDH